MATSGSLRNPGQRDWLAVALTANQPYEITITGLSANADPTLGTAAGLVSDGTFVAWRYGDGVPSPFGAQTWYLYFLPTVSDTYYIDVYDSNALTATENYNVDVATATADVTDNPAAPGTVTVGGQYNGTLTNIGEHDWIAVALVANQAYDITITGLTGSGHALIGTASGLAADSTTAIPAGDGSLYGSGTTQYMYFDPAVSGTYYIDVIDQGRQTSPENYTVAVATATADYTDNASAPGAVAVDGQMSGTLTNLYQHDWVSVALTANQGYEITITAGEFTSVTLGTAASFTSDGTSATSEPDESGFATSATQYMYFMPSASGTYYFDVSDSAPPSVTEPYMIAVAAVTSDYADNPTTTATVTAGGQTSGSLTNTDQHDWVAVSLTANQPYEIAIDGLTGFGSATIGTAGALVADGIAATASFVSEPFDEINKFIYFDPAATGTYYIDVAESNTVTAPEPYTVAVATTTADYSDNPTSPATVAVNGQVSGTLANPGQRDWIAVTLTANQGYEVTETGLSDNASLRVGSAAELAQDGTLAFAVSPVNPGAGTAKKLYFMPATSGTYYIDVFDAAWSPGSYTVAVAAVNTDFGDNASAAGTVTVDSQCFAQGTRIATIRGAIAVEDLRPGDTVYTHFSGRAPVVWTGHRRVDCHRHPRPLDVAPVRVRRGAFGSNRPMRDVLLSPDHAIFVESVLIPVRHLVNGDTISQQPVHEITYWHVELDRHDVIFADGLACESYLDIGDRRALTEDGRGAARLHPVCPARAWEMHGCARLVTTGAPLEAVRRVVQRRALARKAAAWNRHKIGAAAPILWRCSRALSGNRFSYPFG